SGRCQCQHRHLCGRPAGAWPARWFGRDCRHQPRQHRPGPGQRRPAETRPHQAHPGAAGPWLISKSTSTSPGVRAASAWRAATRCGATRLSSSSTPRNGLPIRIASRSNLLLHLTRGGFAPPPGQAIFGSIGDSAPDTWGRRLMQRAKRRLAEREGRAIRTLAESDYLLGVTDEIRLGALRFRGAGDDAFQAPIRAGVPALIELDRLLQVTERILRDEEAD